MLSARRELARKSIHLLAVVFPLWYAAGATRRAMIIMLSAIVVIALGVELTRSRNRTVRELFGRTVGSLLRSHEVDGLSGATWLALALLLAVVAFPMDVAIAAMWCAAVGDALAAIVGRSIGRVRPGGGTKSLEGSVTCFAATLAGALWIAHLPAAESIVAATGGTLAEWPERPFDDNVRMVTASGVAILLWRIVFS